MCEPCELRYSKLKPRNMEHNYSEVTGSNYFESIPNEVQAKLFNYLTLKELIGKLARSSKHAANIIQNSLSLFGGPHNTLNILVTGHHGAGSTTLFTRLEEDIGMKSIMRNLSESSQIKPTFQPVDDHRCIISGIYLNYTRANIWHVSTKENRVKHIYPHCGAAQCIIYVVSCPEISFKVDTLRNDMICYHGLTSNVQWIFVINKMDQVDYNEQEYNKCVDSIKNIAVKVIGEQRMNKLHFVPMSSNDMQTRVTSDSNSIHMPWSNKSTMNLWHVMNQIANETTSSPLKMFRKFRASIVRIYGWGLDQSDKEVGYVIVYVMEGCISVGDKIQILPDVFVKHHDQYVSSLQLYPAVEVVGIQSHGAPKLIALPNSYVGLAIKKPTVYEYNRQVYLRLPPFPKHSIVHYPMVTPENLQKFRDNTWKWHPVYNAVIVHVGHQTGRYKWNGLIHQGFDAAIQSMGIKGGIKIVKINAIRDKHGNSLNLEEVEKERKMLALKKGEMADVVIRADSTLNLTIRDDPNAIINDVNGRFVIQTQNNHIVAVGAITSVPGYLFNEPAIIDQTNKN